MRVCKLGGYSPPEDARIMTRDVVVWLCKGLRKAIERGAVADESRASIENLLRFAEGDGWQGFSIEKKWKDARQ